MNRLEKQVVCLLVFPVLILSQQPICGNYKSINLLNNVNRISSNELNRDVGDIVPFKVFNFEDGNAIVVDTLFFYFYKNEDDVNIFIEESEFNDSSAESAAIDYIIDSFTNYTPDAPNGYQNGIKNAEELMLGPPPQILNNSEVNILFLNIREQVNANIYTAGFFTPNDQRHCFKTTSPYTPLYSHWTKSECLSNNGFWGHTESSNDGNFIYIDIEHFPLSINNADKHLNTIAHEYQHLIHFNIDRYESFPLFPGQTDGHNPWLNEGLSDLMPSILGFGQRDYAPFLDLPTIGLDEWAEIGSSSTLPYYAKSALFFQYLYESHGLDLIGEIFNSTEQGIGSIKSISVNDDFETLYVNWIQSLVMGELEITHLNMDAASENIEDYISMGLNNITIETENKLSKYSFSLFSVPDYLSIANVQTNPELTISLYFENTFFHSEDIVANGINNVEKIIAYTRDFEIDDLKVDIDYSYISSPKKNNLFMYPNPITEDVFSYVYFGDEANEGLILELFDLNGRSVFIAESIGDNYGYHSGEIDIKLSSGIYILKSRLDSGITESRFISVIK